MTMKVAAYQAPLAACGSFEVIDLIREQVDRCESAGAQILCCPEGVVGGLADHVARPASMAIDVEGGQLTTVLSPLASETVTTIVGFTEIDRLGRLYNAAAVFHRGRVIGLYRKLYTAINKSIYQPGDTTPVFTVGKLTFGIVICLDSNYYEPARIMAARGAAALFVPTNNGLPPPKASAKLIDLARNTDIARAIENRMSVIRADVAGQTGDLVSHGSSGIVDPDGMALASAQPLCVDLVMADIETAPRERRRGWDASRNPAVIDEYARLLAASYPDITLRQDGEPV